MQHSNKVYPVVPQKPFTSNSSETGKGEKIPKGMTKFLSLQEEYEKAEEAGRMDPTSKTPYVMGRIEDFRQEELENPPKGVKFFVEFGDVLAVSCGGETHSDTAGAISSEIHIEFMGQYGRFQANNGGSYGVKVKNENSCHVHFTKEVDGSVYLGETNLVKNHQVVVEVGYRHENMDLLLREAEVLLNQHTSVEYTLLVNIISSATDVIAFRFVLCRRVSRRILAKGQKYMEQFNNPCDPDKFGHVRIRDNLLRDRDLTTINPVSEYNLIVVSDQTVERNEIRDVQLPFIHDIIVQGTTFQNDFHGSFLVTISHQVMYQLFHRTPFVSRTENTQ